ncbi:MAG TPA: hypothetical protein DCQ98_09565 [Planctomycetaceae bacterium]|nr:hypothetical protein [Planctomycetaceae bacterium]
MRSDFDEAFRAEGVQRTLPMRRVSLRSVLALRCPSSTLPPRRDRCAPNPCCRRTRRLEPPRSERRCTEDNPLAAVARSLVGRFVPVGRSAEPDGLSLCPRFSP